MKQLVLKPDKVHVCPEIDRNVKNLALFHGVEDLWLCRECHPLLLKASKFTNDIYVKSLKGYIGSRLLARLLPEEHEAALEDFIINIRDNIMAIFQSDHILRSIPRTTVRPYIKQVFVNTQGGYVSVRSYEIIVYPKIIRCLPLWGEYEICEIPIVVDIECSRTVAGYYEIEGFLADEHKPEYNNRRKRRRFGTLGLTEEEGGS